MFFLISTGSILSASFEPFSLVVFFLIPLFPSFYSVFSRLFSTSHVFRNFLSLSTPFRYFILLFLQDEKSGALSPACSALAPVFSGQFRSQLALHPAFYDIYERCESHLLAGDGPLPYDYRHYIAILVSHEQVSQGFGRRKKVIVRHCHCFF
jgi:hypothetical protein